MSDDDEPIEEKVKEEPIDIVTPGMTHDRVKKKSKSKVAVVDESGRPLAKKTQRIHKKINVKAERLEAQMKRGCPRPDPDIPSKPTPIVKVPSQHVKKPITKTPMEIRREAQSALDSLF